ncbi:MAG: tRNA 2-thiouridine(34) synthase MnmA [Campylobacterales bacterium]|nr:tRNA 2-thiouridine(34) synthase MnmA [Campylobacterales bacterium]
MSKVLVGLSGGVDSTLTAYLLQQEGYQVIGCYMKLFENDSYHEKNLRNIEKIASYLNIDYHVEDLANTFTKNVYEPFVNGYISGETPNPCGLCNKTMKFGEMAKLADKYGCEFLATGHYLKTDGEYIYQGLDKSKDQSYFLFYIDKEILPRVIFPMGDRYKEKVKELVNDIEPLKEIAQQKESQEICFVDTNYRDIIKRHTDIDTPGDLIDKEKNIVGTHKGYIHYTTGQRKGFTLKKPPEGPRYVLRTFPKKNQVMIGTKEDLESFELEIKDLNFFVPYEDFEATVKIRYSSKMIPCSVTFQGKEKATIKLQEPGVGIASGQAAVFYHDERVLGGGWII